MMHGSTIFTIGTALRRAEANNVPVEVLVYGHWLRGTVAGVDGHGIILSTHAEHSVVRLEAISAVRIPEQVPDAPVAETFDDHHVLTVAEARDDDAYAMPGSVSA
jgi:sRNA-binding regulator protein Hfq